MKRFATKKSVPPGLQTYYRRFYRPSNARFRIWGDGLREEERLALLDSFLKGLGTSEVDSEIGTQPLYVVRPEAGSGMSFSVSAALPQLTP